VARVVAPLVLVSFLAAACTPARVGGPRPEPIPEGILDNIDNSLPPLTTPTPAMSDDPGESRVSLGDDSNPWVQVGQSAAIVGLFVAASALCGDGSCRLP
jgi:hypothetical protein